MSEVFVVQKMQQGTKWSIVTEIGTKLISPITNMILARLLTPEAFGVVATVTMITSFADMFSDAGFQKFLIQHDFEDEDEFFKSTTVAFWTNLAISVFAWLLIFLFSEPLAALVGNEGLGNVIWIAALSLPLTSFSSIQMAHYRKQFKFNILFWIRMVAAAVPLVVTVPLAFITRSYWALIIGTLVGNVINAGILTICSDWRPTFYYSISRLKEMFSYSWWILLESIVVWLTSYIGTFIVSIYLTQQEVGLYKTGMNTVNQIVSLITSATSAPLFSALSVLKNDNDAFEKIYIRYIRAIGTFVIPMGIGIYIYHDVITKILLGDQWMQISSFIGLWGVVSSFTIIWGTYCNGVYNAKGKPKLSVLSQVLHLIVLVPVIIIGCKIGFQTLCTMRSLVRIQMILVQMIIMKFAIHFSLVKYMKSSFTSILCSVIMAAVSIVCLHISDNIVWQIISMFISMIIYFIAYFILFRKIILDTFQAIGVPLPKKICARYEEK